MIFNQCKKGPVCSPELVFEIQKSLQSGHRTASKGKCPCCVVGYTKNANVLIREQRIQDVYMPMHVFSGGIYTGPW